MKKYKNDWVWNEVMCHHLDKSTKLSVSIYTKLFMLSHRNTSLMLWFLSQKHLLIERNRQLEQKRGIVQVKMKWGYLTIYYDGGKDPYLDEIINTAAKMAESKKDKLDKMYDNGGSAIEKYFTQVRIDNLPEGKKPKFRIGDLVRISFAPTMGQPLMN